MVGRRASSDLQRHDEKVSSKHDSNPENIVGRKVIRFSLHPNISRIALPNDMASMTYSG